LSIRGGPHCKGFDPSGRREALEEEAAVASSRSLSGLRPHRAAEAEHEAGEQVLADLAKREAQHDGDEASGGQQ